MKERKVSYAKTTFPRKIGLPYFPISVLSNFNLHQPLLYLCRILLDDPELYFTEPLRLPQPKAAVDPEYVEDPLPHKIRNDDDDDDVEECIADIRSLLLWGEKSSNPHLLSMMTFEM